MTALFIGPAEEADLAALRHRAEADHVDVREIIELMKSEPGRKQHMDRMTKLSTIVNGQFVVVFSIEFGHPVGICRHLSVSMEHGGETGRVVSPAGAWMIAECFGFWGDLSDCVAWPEDFRSRGPAMNIVQPMERPK